MSDFVLASRRIVLPESIHDGGIQVSRGKISKILSRAEISSGEILDVGDRAVLPGIVDTHAHINEPGRTEWEGFETATRAAAAGGVTTVVDMPLNCIPATTSREALAAKRRAAIGRCHVDVGFWGGVVPGNDAELENLIDDGVRGFKCFLVPSGVDEFPASNEDDLRRALPVLARRNVPLLVHAESPALIATMDRGARYADYLATRPPEAEIDAVRMM